MSKNNDRDPDMPALPIPSEGKAAATCRDAAAVLQQYHWETIGMRGIPDLDTALSPEEKQKRELCEAFLLAVSVLQDPTQAPSQTVIEYAENGWMSFEFSQSG